MREINRAMDGDDLLEKHNRNNALQGWCLHFWPSLHIWNLSLIHTDCNFKTNYLPLSISLCFNISLSHLDLSISFSSHDFWSRSGMPFCCMSFVSCLVSLSTYFYNFSCMSSLLSLNFFANQYHLRSSRAHFCQSKLKNIYWKSKSSIMFFFPI